MRASVRAYTAALRQPQRQRPPPRMVGILASTATTPGSSSSRRNRRRHCSEWAAETYSHTIAAAFAEDGLEYELRRVGCCAPENVQDAIRAANRDDSVHGVLVFYPIFANAAASSSQQQQQQQPSEKQSATFTTRRMFLNRTTGTHYKTRDDCLRDCVAPGKDVEGLCHGAAEARQNRRRLFRARGGLHHSSAAAGAVPSDSSSSSSGSIYIPCTAQAVLRILERYHLKKERHHRPHDVGHTTSDSGGDGSSTATKAPFDYSDTYHDQQQQQQQLQHQPWKGRTVTVINRSTILGRPLSALLALRGATVYSVDDRSILQFQNNGRGVARLHSRRRRNSNHHHRAAQLRDCLARSSVIVTAVPGDCGFGLDCSAVQDHTTIVDVSDDRSNVCLAQLQRRSVVGVQLISNIGKVTVAALEQNLVRLHQQHINTMSENSYY